ncbi:DUF805 domain-containing protein [Pseudooceanicola sp.]|uniref:DUF805 domain-containing protein n=1 Tax=Pseudooceanicola sp. TaxID=1914328 RepID=UPI0035C66F9A
MTFQDAVKTCFRKYITFSGRATRPEYWWFVLFVFLGSILAEILDTAIFGFTEIEVERSAGHIVTEDRTGPFDALFSLATLLPLLAVGWRRMHDTGRSGLYLLYPILVWVGIGTFASMAGVTGELMSGNFAAAFTGLVGIIMIISILIAIFSPLIVIWWLTRPTQPGPNDYGPNPNEVSP